MTYSSKWDTKPLKHIALINPDADEELSDGTIVKQVNLDKLKPYSKFIDGFDTVEFDGKGSKFRNNDTLVPKISSALVNGKTAFVNVLDEGEIGIGSSWFIVLRGIDNICDPDFLYYLATTPWFRELAGKTLEGSTKSRYININILKEYEFQIPAYEEQHRLASVLKVIDDKIDKNIKVCAAIEKILERIFHDRFNKYNFHNQELPQGWRQGFLYEIGDIVAGSTPSKKVTEYYSDCSIPWITPRDLSKQGTKFISKGAIDITEKGLNNCSASKLPRGTVLFSSRAPIGYVAIASNELVTNQGFRSIVPFSGVGSTFVYYLLCSKIDEIINMATGSTFKEISGQALKKLKIIVPDKTFLTSFDKHTMGLMRYQENIESENHLLGRIRDNLLPLLISGALRVYSGDNK